VQNRQTFRLMKDFLFLSVPDVSVGFFMLYSPLH
jgi:hypothetical protein